MIEQASHTALIVVDVQNDFCEGGALAVKGGTAVAEHVAEYLEHHHRKYRLIVASRDWHRPNSDNGGHFAKPGEVPNFTTTWPVHCVQNTPGAQFQAALDPVMHFIDVQVMKGDGKPAYSAFEGFTSGGVPLREVLDEHQIDTVNIVGIATDYCVCATAEDSQAFGYKTTVFENLCAGVAPQTTAEQLTALHDLHVHLRNVKAAV